MKQQTLLQVVRLFHAISRIPRQLICAAWGHQPDYLLTQPFAMCRCCGKLLGRRLRRW